MKLIEAIDAINEQKPNLISDTEKIRWLSELDGRVKKEVIDTHNVSELVSFNTYNGDTPYDTELLIKEPYDSLYIYWLSAKIDYANNEYTRYNNSISLFNSNYEQFSNYYNRTNMPKWKKVKYF